MTVDSDSVLLLGQSVSVCNSVALAVCIVWSYYIAVYNRRGVAETLMASSLRVLSCEESHASCLTENGALMRIVLQKMVLSCCFPCSQQLCKTMIATTFQYYL